jgi:hypothetical protein
MIKERLEEEKGGTGRAVGETLEGLYEAVFWLFLLLRWNSAYS